MGLFLGVCVRDSKSCKGGYKGSELGVDLTVSLMEELRRSSDYS